MGGRFFKRDSLQTVKEVCKSNLFNIPSSQESFDVCQMRLQGENPTHGSSWHIPLSVDILNMSVRLKTRELLLALTKQGGKRKMSFYKRRMPCFYHLSFCGGAILPVPF